MKQHSPEQIAQINNRIRTMQLIVVVLSVSVVGFATVLIALSGAGLNRELNLLIGIMLLLAANSMGISYLFRFFVFPKQARASLASDLNRDEFVDDSLLSRLLDLYQNQTIVCSALLEGSAIFALTCYLLYPGNLYCLLVASVMVAIMVFHLPTSSRFLDWMERVEST